MLDFGKQSERLNRLWIRLHAKLEELQNGRKAEEREAAAPPAETAKPKSKSEPGVVEITSFQRTTAIEPSGAGSVSESKLTPTSKNEPDQPCTGK